MQVIVCPMPVLCVRSWEGSPCEGLGGEPGVPSGPGLLANCLSRRARSAGSIASSHAALSRRLRRVELRCVTGPKTFSWIDRVVRALELGDDALGARGEDLADRCVVEERVRRRRWRPGPSGRRWCSGRRRLPANCADLLLGIGQPGGELGGLLLVLRLRRERSGTLRPSWRRRRGRHRRSPSRWWRRRRRPRSGPARRRASSPGRRRWRRCRRRTPCRRSSPTGPARPRGRRRAASAS